MAVAVNKRHFYKIFNSSGTYLQTWADEVVSTPSFTWSINGSMGEEIVTLARSVTSFGETDDVAMFNKVETWIQDGDALNGIRIHSGYITGYDIRVTADGKQEIDVHIYSLTNELEVTMLKDGSDTAVSYASVEPANIFKDVLTKAAKTITYNASTIKETATTVSYDFTYATAWEALNKAIELCPAYWYWYIDANNLLYLSDTDFDTVSHTLFLGKEIQNLDFFKTVENLYNTVYFAGGGDPNLYKKYERTSSQTEHGIREIKEQDGRVTVEATAETISNKFLDENDHFEQRLTCTVIDNNGSKGQIGGVKGYDIESLRPGDVVVIKHPQSEVRHTLWDVAQWDVDFWDFNIAYSIGIPMQIQSITYAFNTADLTLSTRLPDISKRIEDIERNAETTATEAIPDTPT